MFWGMKTSKAALDIDVKSRADPCDNLSSGPLLFVRKKEYPSHALQSKVVGIKEIKQGTPYLGSVAAA